MNEYLTTPKKHIFDPSEVAFATATTSEAEYGPTTGTKRGAGEVIVLTQAVRMSLQQLTEIVHDLVGRLEPVRAKDRVSMRNGQPEDARCASTPIGKELVAMLDGMDILREIVLVVNDELEI